jgi:hypothetical protein
MNTDISASNMLDSIAQEIDLDGSFSNVAVDVKNVNYTYSNIFPRELPVHDLSLWGDLGEIDLERAKYLLSTDDMLEEMLSRT